MSLLTSYFTHAISEGRKTRAFGSLAVTGLALWLAVAPVSAQSGSAPANYRFAAGDVIDVTVSPQHNFDRTLTVQPDGKISYPLIGQLEAAGLTVEQLGDKIHDGLNRDLVDPVVTVALKEEGKREVGRVSLLGAVRNQGAIDIRKGTTLSEALAAAGGPTAEADLHRVTITRADGTLTSVNLSLTGQSAPPEARLVVQPGDVIFVPEGPRPTVLVLGEVSKPSSYELQKDERLLDAVSQAGGLTEKADVRRVTLAHLGGGAPQTLDLQPLLAKGDTTQGLNVVLKPGDTLFIPATEQQVLVVGNVSKPALYPLRPGDRVLNMLVTAGGAGAGTSKAVLVRRNASGKQTVQNLDLKKILERGDMAQNELLQPGDVLYVPDKKTHRSFLESLNLLYPLTYLLTAIP